MLRSHLQDIVTHFLLLDVTTAPSQGCANITLALNADSTGQSGAAYGDVVSYQIHFGNRSDYENGDACGSEVTCNPVHPKPNSKPTDCGGAACNCTGRGRGSYGYDCAYRGNYNEQVSCVNGYALQCIVIFFSSLLSFLVFSILLLLLLLSHP
jgi:hypothetical protein